jgi:hypothetical protein
MSLQVVPLSTAPNQSFAAALNVDGAALTLNLDIHFNEMAGYWVMSISDANNNLLIDSVPMLTGSWPAGNLLAQQQYLKIGSAYIVNVSNINSVSPSSTAAGGDIGFGQGGFGQGGYGGAGYGGSTGLGGLDYPDDTNLGTDFELWWDDTPVN